MAMKKKIIRRKAPKKNTGVSKKVKEYVKRIAKTPGRPMVCDDIVAERTVTVGQMYFQDAFMNATTNQIPLNDSRSLHSSGLKIKYIVYSNSTTTPLLVRFLVLETLKGGGYSDYKATTPSANISTAATELFESGVDTGSAIGIDVAFNTSSNSSNMLRRINKNNYKVHRDFTLNLGTSAADRANFSQGTLWVPFKRIVKYDDSGSSSEIDPVNTKLVLLAIPHEVPQDPAVPPTQQVEISSCVSWYYRC